MVMLQQSRGFVRIAWISFAPKDFASVDHPRLPQLGRIVRLEVLANPGGTRNQHGGTFTHVRSA